MSEQKKTRRVFLSDTAKAGAAFWAAGVVGGTRGADAAPRAKPRPVSKNEKLNVGCIGAGGRGTSNVGSLSQENIVALCDLDSRWAKKSFEKHPKAKKFEDFRVMFDKMHKELDAVAVSTPDHQHAVAAMMAIKHGKHVYCEKPLTHDIYEARALAKAAKEYGVVTQMGNQGTSNDMFRKGVDAIRAGVIGKIREVHVWTDRPTWPQGQPTPTGSDQPPPHLNWDLWLGTAPARPYKSNKYHPFFWRGWWDFGTGALGDMGCHTINLPHMALHLDVPTSVESEHSGFNGDSFPTWSLIKFAFPARGDQPPVTMTWYDGSPLTKPPKVLRKLTSMIHGEKLGVSGAIMIGEKGTWYSPHNYGGKWVLLPKERFAGYEVERKLPRSPGQHREWVEGCKGGPKPMSSFDYASRLTETILLGNLATYAGKKILWDAPKGEVTNCPKANAKVRREYREGWSL